VDNYLLEERLVSNRTGLVSQIRGILAERGIVCAQSITRARREIPAVIADTTNCPTPLAREMLADLLDQLRELDKRIAGFDRRIDIHRRDLLLRRPQEICHGHGVILENRSRLTPGVHGARAVLSTAPTKHDSKQGPSRSRIDEAPIGRSCQSPTRWHESSGPCWQLGNRITKQLSLFL
jgi:hypothetical protein